MASEMELTAACELYELLAAYYDDSAVQPPIVVGDKRHKAICEYRAALPKRRLPPGEAGLMRRLLDGSRAKDVDKCRDSQSAAEQWAELLLHKYPSLITDESYTSAPDATHGNTSAASLEAAGRGVAPRNAWFLAQHEAYGTDTFRKPKAIQQKWSAMTHNERAAICPGSTAKVSHSAVAKGIQRARLLRDGKPAKPTAKRKRAKKKV